jgi:release factor glutamine methyltransferase
LPIANTLQFLRSRLEDSSDTPGLDAQVLLAHVMEVPRAWLLAHPEAKLTPLQQARLQTGLAQLESGQPLPYVLGHWEFYGLDFAVSPAVLIPRPETELLVDQALGWLLSHPNRKRVVDVGTGSGCIAISLAVHRPGLRVLAGDISLPALQVARQNARAHRVEKRVDFLQTDLLPPVSQAFDLLCANLPYIPSETLKHLKVYRTEPTVALQGGAQGLDLIAGLLQSSPGCMAPGGLLLLEIEATQGEAVRDLAFRVFPQAQVEVLPDLAGRDRLARIQLPGSNL